MIIMPVVKSLRALKAPAHTSIHIYSIPQADVNLMTGAHLVPDSAVPTPHLHPPPSTTLPRADLGVDLRDTTQ